MIRNFEAYLTERKLIQTCPLSALADTRLGIDLPHYLRHLLSSPATREPLVATTGGQPLAITSLIEADLRSLEKLRIKPVFVCPGLPLAKRPPGKNGVDTPRENGIKREAWENYEEGKVDETVKLLEGTVWTEQRDLFRLVLRIFRHRSVEFIVAPYLTSAQLVYLQKHQHGYIHSIYGSHEALLYTNSTVDRLILSLDLSASTLKFVNKAQVLKDLGNLSEDQFLDIALLSGSELTPSFPPFVPGGWRAVFDAVKGFKSGVTAISPFLNDPAVKELGYPDLFVRARCAIKFSFVLTAEEGRCTPLPLSLPQQHSQHHSHSQHQPHQSIVSASEIPNDLHEVFSNRLPDEIYFQISRGLVSPQLIGWLTSGMIVEQPPLDNGESTEFRRFIQEVITEGNTSPRCTALALVSSVLNPTFWGKKPVLAYYYFNTPTSNSPPNARIVGRPVPHNDKQTLALIDRCVGWHVPCLIVEEELRRQNSSTIDFALCLGATSEEQYAARTRRPKVPSSAVSSNDKDREKESKDGSAHLKPLEKKDEIVTNVIWRFLDIRGFFNQNHTHGTLAQALHTGIKASRVNDKFQEPLYLALELIRAGVLHGDLWSGKAWSGGPSFGTDSEKASMLLVMRVLSIVPLTFKNQQWSGPLSRELLVFNSFLKSLSRSLRHLLEAVSLHMLLRNEARRVREDFLDISLSLPFQTDVNTGFGILVKVYLDATIAIYGNAVQAGEEGSDEAKEAKKEALEVVEDNFVGIKNARAEVERGFRFWDAVLAAVRSLAASQSRKTPNNVDIQKHVVDQFEAADKWLRPMLPTAP